ncbi:MAG TPA: YceI family protein, partial [Polyangiaceae bacterium]|nr:YceI family protein [Polyangiaceae bacterium]
MSLEKWEIDSSHSGIFFSVRHMVIAKVRGQFSRWSGNIVIEDGDMARAKVEVVIDASSIDTGVADRDAHLKNPDFLDVENFPELTFQSVRVEKQGEENFRLIGNLTIHGVTREVVLDAESAGQTKDPWGNVRAGYAAKTSINRKDFGLTW